MSSGKREGVASSAPTSVARIFSADGHFGAASRLVSAASGPCLATTLDGTVTDWNRHSSELLGYSPSETLGASLLDLLQPTDYFGNAYRTTGATLAEQILAGQAVHAFELDLHTSEARSLRVAVSLVFFLDSDQEQSRAVYLLSPIHRRRRADEVLERMLDEGRAPLAPKRRASDPTPSLSLRQRQVLRLLVDGLSAPAIATRLGISVHTVRNHIQSIYTRLGVTTRAAAVSKALSARSL